MYTTGKIPDNFKKSVIVMLPKKCESTECEEYRSLCISKRPYKTLTKIIFGRIVKNIDGKINLAFERIEAHAKLFCVCEAL